MKLAIASALLASVGVVLIGFAIVVRVPAGRCVEVSSNVVELAPGMAADPSCASGVSWKNIRK